MELLIPLSPHTAAMRIPSYGRLLLASCASEGVTVQCIVRTRSDMHTQQSPSMADYTLHDSRPWDPWVWAVHCWLLLASRDGTLKTCVCIRYIQVRLLSALSGPGRPALPFNVARKGSL